FQPSGHKPTCRRGHPSVRDALGPNAMMVVKVWGDGVRCRFLVALRYAHLQPRAGCTSNGPRTTGWDRSCVQNNMFVRYITWLRNQNFRVSAKRKRPFWPLWLAANSTGLKLLTRSLRTAGACPWAVSIRFSTG